MKIKKVDEGYVLEINNMLPDGADIFEEAIACSMNIPIRSHQLMSKNCTSCTLTIYFSADIDFAKLVELSAKFFNQCIDKYIQVGMDQEQKR
jgi:hypothetical protein